MQDPGQAESDGKPRTSEPGRPRRSIRRRLARLVGLLAVAYLLFLLPIYLFQEHLIYFPSRAYQAHPSDVGLAYESLELTTSDGVGIAAWFVPHPRPRGTVIFCHGNAGNMADRLVDLKLLHELALSVLIFDYRGFGESDAAPHEQGTYRDVEAAWQYVSDYLTTPSQKILLFGRSLGGAVAIESARRHAPGALVVESTFTTLADVGQIHFRMLPVRLILRNHYDSISKIPDIRCPKLLLHGTDDSLIPIEQARRLFAAAAEPKTFIETPGGHNEAGFGYGPDSLAAFRAFLDTHLPIPPGDTAP